MTSNLLPAVGPVMETGTNAELSQSPRYIRFGSFQIDQQRQQVFRNGTRLKLQGKVYQVLLALIAKHGQVVTRDELKHTFFADHLCCADEWKRRASRGGGIQGT